MKKNILISLTLLFICFRVNAGLPQAPSSTRVDLLLYTDKVWDNGFLTSLTLEEAKLSKHLYQIAYIRSTHPSFSWVVNSASPNSIQTAYQILLSSSKEKTDAGVGDIWDSGKVSGNQSTNVFKGTPLVQNRIYYWKVRIWDNTGGTSLYSDVKAFQTAAKISDYETAYYPLIKSEQLPISEKHLTNRNVVYDFGKDAFAQLHFTAYTPSGRDTAFISVGEACQPDGHVESHPNGSVRYRFIPVALQQGTHTYELKFTPDERNTGPKAIQMPDYIGEVFPFRYIELMNSSNSVIIKNLNRYAISYPFDEESTTFTSSDTVLNKVWELSKYSMKATSFTGYYVDGDRERIPYEADVLINQLSHYASDAEYNMAKRSLSYLIYHATWPSEWSLQNLLIAWNDYLYSGDIRTVKLLYPELKAKLLLALARKDGLISTKTGKQSSDFIRSIHFDTFNGNTELKDIVDWPQKGVLGLGKNESGETDGFVFGNYNSVVNAYHYQALQVMAALAYALDEKQDAAFYKERAQKVKKSFQTVFIDKKRGVISDGEGIVHSSLHANMFALAFGLVPEKYQGTVLSYMRSRGMACSVYGSQFLLDALYNACESKDALKLLTSTGTRSWYNMIRSGSTITTEAWDMKYKPNQDWNHAWGAAPANIIVRKLMGVEPLTAAFETVQIKPQPDTLGAASLNYLTLRGHIVVKFENTTQKFKLKIDLPANMSSIIYLPRKNSRSVITQNGIEIKAISEGKFWKINNVGSGNHEWEVTYLLFQAYNCPLIN
ncbi:alpha-L-rhamnosidase C-terminal domain-containing protein [Mucilaginibacter sp.]|jgi:hypothetical protein|uniref:alpha-L-rhamnosidase-related protein n=1 Tax=Mucilaginibacter sp. TaxID=1882438 RepID=UPI003568DF17